MATLVYQYGIIRHAKERGGPRTRIPEEIWDEQLRLAHQMKNELVALEYQHEARVEELWLTYPSVAGPAAELAAAEEQFEELRKRAAKERSADRSIAARPATAEEIKACKARVKAARDAKRQAIALVRNVAKPQLERLKAEHKEAIKTCRQEFSEKGLYWATYNAVLTDHSVRVQLVARARKEGRPARLRFHRFDGTGSVSVQLQRQHGTACRCPGCAAKLTAAMQKQLAAACPGCAEKTCTTHLVAADPAHPPQDPPRTPQLIASDGGKWRNVLQVKPWMPPAEFAALPRHKQREVGYGEVVWCVGQGRTVTLPVRTHRMLPEDAEICEAQITIRRIGGQWTAALNLTVQLPDPEPVEGKPVASLHVGWRARPDGSARAAVWACTQPLSVPQRLRDIVVARDGGRWGEVVLPGRWLDYAGRPAAVRSDRDKMFEPVRAALADWLEEHPEACDERLTPGWVRMWRTPARLAALVNRWRIDGPPAGCGQLVDLFAAWRASGEKDLLTWLGGEQDRPAADLVALLEGWRRQDKHLWRYEGNERAQHLDLRDDAYRRVAAWLAGQVGMLVVDNTKLSAIRTRPDPADADPTLPGVAADRARARAALVAPGRLRQIAVATHQQAGAAVTEVEATNASRLHRQDGYLNAAHPQFAAAAMVVCGQCGLTYDQDRNAAELMIDRATGRTP